MNQRNAKTCAIPAKGGDAKSIHALLDVPWLGVRQDVVLHQGPLDHDGQRSWVLEDPVRGNIFRIGHVEGELLFHLTMAKDLDAAINRFFRETAFRPSIEEIAVFVRMLQRESLAILPEEEVIRRDTHAAESSAPGFLHRFLQTPIFFRVPLLRPDAFLSRTAPWISFLWSPFFKWVYILCGVLGLVLTLQEIELYLGTVNYLFTPQGAAAFVFSLVALKIGHEFAHGFAAKSMGLHVRSMGILFIVFWPLLYTDTTDAWKIPDRRRRIWVSAAGVLFELAIGGMALLLWALLPDGIPRSLMFFLSGTSLATSVFINLNPFMRYDGYYLLMDLWGVDNLRVRSFGMLRYAVLRFLFGWKGLSPEIHPHKRSLIIYGFLAVCYRLLIAVTIAAAVYYLLFPELGLLLLVLELWLFVGRPLAGEVRNVIKNRERIGSKIRAGMTLACLAGFLVLVFAPIPRYENLPCLLLIRGATRVEASSPGRLATAPPEIGTVVAKGGLIARIESDALFHEARNTRYDLDSVRASIKSLGTGGKQGAYRNWLLAEENRLAAAAEKIAQAIALLEIRAQSDGKIVDVNQDVHQGAFVKQGAWLFTVANSDEYELKAYVHEKLVSRMDMFKDQRAEVRFPDPNAPVLEARIREKSLFPAYRIPNDGLYDFAGGPIVSVRDSQGMRPRDAYFPFTFDVGKISGRFPHGAPSWIWMKSDNRSLAGSAFSEIRKSLMERGLF